ncbi:MAG: Zn-ribbon domain-containing OB-fold protein [Thermodesulfobacteriota bacterium]
MNDLLASVEPLVVESGIRVPYSWWAGETIGRFLMALRDECRIYATRCDHCSRVMIPPRKTCPLCFAENLPWQEVSPIGTVQGFTIIRKPRAAWKRPVPAVVGLILLDGSTTSMLHFIAGVDPETVHIGMRVQAIFAEVRKGHILDIAYFCPVASG